LRQHFRASSRLTSTARAGNTAQFASEPEKAESMGFKGDYRQWEQLLRVGD
jgi:hypothetical protein